MDLLQAHLFNQKNNVRDALISLDQLSADAILFIVDDENRLIGSLTDGDIRRGFIKGLDFETSILDYIQPNPKFIFEDEFEFEDKKTSALLKFNNKEEKFNVEFDSFEGYMFVCAFEKK